MKGDFISLKQLLNNNNKPIILEVYDRTDTMYKLHKPDESTSWYPINTIDRNDSIKLHKRSYKSLFKKL